MTVMETSHLVARPLARHPSMARPLARYPSMASVVDTEYRLARYPSTGGLVCVLLVTCGAGVLILEDWVVNC